MESFWILTVDSKNSVSLGGTLWKTTLEIDDFPLLQIIISHRCFVSHTLAMPATNEQD